jgi:hypothetical protein
MKKYLNKILTVVLLLALFSVSIYIRKKDFNQPLGRHHEWLVAHTIMTMTVWDQGGGPQNFHFAPVYTFEGEANGNIKAFEGVVDAKRDAYYLSYPPFGLLFPYFVFKLLGLDFTVANFQVFNYVLHFTIAFSLFCFLNYLFRKKFDSWYIPSYIGFIFYVFTNGLLWFHGNTYFVDMLMQLFFVAQVYFLVRALREFEFLNKKFFLYYGLVTFFACYTDWLACFIALISGLILLGHAIYYKRKKLLALFLVVGASSTFSGLTTIAQYSSVAGFKEYKEAMERKYKVRSGNGDPDLKHLDPIWGDPNSLRLIKEHVNRNFHLVINFTGIALGLYFVLFIFLKQYRIKWEEFWLLLAMGVPIVMHYYFFFNFNVLHDFSTLKTALFCIVLIALVFSRLDALIKNTITNKYIQVAVFSVLLVGLGFRIKKNVKQYHEVNAMEHVHHYNVNIGTAIKKYAKPDRVVFSNTPIYPETMYYCHRNSMFALCVKHTIGWLRENKMKKGVFFKNEGEQVLEVYEFNDLGDSTLIYKQH